MTEKTRGKRQRAPAAAPEPSKRSSASKPSETITKDSGRSRYSTFKAPANNHPFIAQRRDFQVEPSIDDVLSARARRRRLNSKYTANEVALACALTGVSVLALCLLVWVV